jgi:hypothetical protein
MWNHSTRGRSPDKLLPDVEPDQSGVGDIAPDFNLKNLNDTNDRTQVETEVTLDTKNLIV